jgi:hypothetical protein
MSCIRTKCQSLSWKFSLDGNIGSYRYSGPVDFQLKAGDTKGWRDAVGY